MVLEAEALDVDEEVAADLGEDAVAGEGKAHGGEVGAGGAEAGRPAADPRLQPAGGGAVWPADR